MGPIKGNNEKGFWEDRDIYNLNEAIIKKLNSNWDSFTCIQFNDTNRDILKAEKNEALKILSLKFKDKPTIGIKDPRFSILLPFWKDIFNDLDLDVCYVIAVRNPFSVAESLKKRDLFEPEKGLFLWIKHMAYSIRHTNNETRVFVDYDLLLKNPRKELTRIAQTIDEPAPNRANAEFAEYENCFLSTTLNHHSNTHTDAFSITEKRAKTLYLNLSKVTSASVAPPKNIKFGALNLERLNFFLRKIDDLSRENSELTSRSAMLYDKTIELEAFANKKIGDLTKQNAQLASQIEALEDENNRLSTTNRELTETIKKILSSTSWKVSAPIRLFKQILIANRIKSLWFANLTCGKTNKKSKHSRSTQGGSSAK